jgi:ubiquitin carboxyl-terminal hydrolase 8
MTEHQTQPQPQPQPRNRFNEYNDKGITGLANLGNTCFINACIQCLSHTYELNDFLSNGDGEYKKHLNNKPESVLLVEWDDLRKLMWSQNCVISPGRFINTIQRIAKITNRDLFTGWSQNDLPEFLLFLFDSFHSALTREVIMDIKGNIKTKKDEMGKACYEMMKTQYTKDYSEFLNIFFGIHVSVLTPITEKGKGSANGSEGEDLNYLSLRPEPYMLIHLPIPSKEEVNIKNMDKNVTLFDCFNKQCECELLEGDNAWFNENENKKQNVNKRLLFWSLPNIMIIDIKRFITSMNGKSKKNQQFIDIPINDVDFSKYVEGYAKETYIYDLYAICNHHGQIDGGHYSATIKNSNGKWYNFNDTQVTEILVNDNIISGNTPYCLFYRKKKLVELYI